MINKSFSCSPVALFVYKRPEHTKRALEALMNCPEFYSSPFYVFADGPRKPEDINDVEKTREVIKQVATDNTFIYESDLNQGLANSIISSVSMLVDKYDQVIVLEDDLIVSPYFLSYMNQALDMYRHEEKVMQVSGYMFPIQEFYHRTQAMFLPFTVSWGWATWKRAWKLFDAEASGCTSLKYNLEMKYKFNLNDSYDFFNMLEQQINGEIDSWAICWYWSVFKNNGYVLFPPRSLVVNIGFDGSGTHGSLSLKQFSKETLDPCQLNVLLPTSVEVHENEFILVRHKIKSMHSGFVVFVKKIISFLKLRKILKSLI